MFFGDCVWLFVGKITKKVRDQCSRKVDNGKKNRGFVFGADLDHLLDPGTF